MNILLPDSWLREYLDTDATPKQIKDCLSLCGPSVERVNKVEGDYIYEIEITSNRVDMASVYGVAREAVAILPRFGIKAALKHLKGGLKDSFQVKEPDNLPMDVSDPQKICNRIMGIVMEVDTLKDSPGFLKERIEKSGIRSLNNLVDITNFVMLELGHPCHVFDYDRIKTHKFLIRFAKKNEPIITLDNKKYLLDPEDVIIDDGTGRVIDLPGIMGTENSVINQNTKKIFFFIESNNPVFIRKTSMRYGIRTMAATINEKHPDPELVKTALLRGMELYKQIAGGKISSNIIDIYPNQSKPQNIKVSTRFINDRLGVELKANEMVDILKSLSFDIESSVIPSEQGEARNPSTGLSSHSREIPRQARDDILHITPPSFRQFDVTIPEDIVEEVARIYGYHNLPNRLMTGEIPQTVKPKILPLEEKIKNILKFWGHTEIYNYSFISKELIEKANLKTSDHLKVANPLTADIEYMRISLIPSMLETIAKNQFYSDNLELFELANIYIPKKNDLPNEIPILAISNQEDFYKLKGVVSALAAELGLTDIIENIPQEDKDYAGTWRHFWHPQQLISIKASEKIIAYIGKIHPTLSQNFQLKNDLYLAVLNVELLAELSMPLNHYTPISQYPAVIEDLTLEFPPKTFSGPIISEIYKINKLIKNVDAIDRYKNSTTLRITYQDEKKNLESADVQKVRTQILQTLKSQFEMSLKLKK